MSVRLGDRLSRACYATLLVAGVLLPVAGVLARALPWAALIVLLASPLAVRPLRLSRGGAGRGLAPLLPATAKLHLGVGVALTLALAVSPLS